MTHALYDIWEEKTWVFKGFDWRLQLVGYVAYFSSQKAAEEYAESVKKERAKK